MNSNGKIVIITLILILGTLLSKASEYKMEQFRFNRELPSKSVRCITQDQQGLIWIGTNDWISYYDGYKITNLPVPENMEKGGLSKRIYCIQSDSHDNIWFGTPLGVYIYNKKKETIDQLYPDKDNLRNKSNVIYSIALSPDKKIFLGTRNGIFVYNESRNNLELFTHFAYHTEFKEATKSERIAKNIYFDKLGLLWIGTEGNGIVMINLKDNSRSHYRHILGQGNGLPSNFIEDIYEDRFGNLWVTTNNGLARYQRSENIFENYNKYGISGLISSITDDGDRSLLLGSDNGLIQYDRSNQHISRIKNIPENDRSLPSNDVRCLYKDRSGAIWTGTSKGICKINDEPDFPIYRNIPGDNNSLKYNNLSFIQADTTGNILWIGSGKSDIDRYDLNTQTFSHFQLRGNEGQLPSYINTGLLTQDKMLLVGTDTGLFKLDTKTGISEFFNFSSEKNIPLENIYTMLETNQGDIWFGILDKGLYRFDNKTGKFGHIPVSENNDKKDIFTNIKVLFEDSQNKIWMVFYQGGVGRYNPETTDTELYDYKNTNGDLPDNIVWDIIELNDGRILFATASGITFFDPEKNKFEQDSYINNIINGSVLSAIQDDRGIIWLGTEQGILKLNLKNKDIIRFSESDGLQSNIFNYQVKAKIGAFLFFGGNNGFNMIDSESQNPSSFTSIPSILNISKNNKYLNIRKLPIKNGLPCLNINTSDQNYSISFSNYSYIKEWRNRFQYKIIPYDTIWNWVGLGKNKFTLPKLPAGKYTLVLKGSNVNGKWSNPENVLLIEVTSIWTTIMLISLVIFIALLSTFYLLNLKYPKFYKKYNRIRIKNKTGIRKQKITDSAFLKTPDEKTQKIIDELFVLMEEKHIYLNKRLNKAQLAATLKLTELQLASILKDYIGKGFNDFINYYRVKAVKEKLKDPAYKDITLVAIGEECGFNSKTSFYRVFKDLTGITPAEYLEKLQD